MSSLLAADKEFAACRESNGGHTMRGVRYGLGRRARRRARAEHAACRGGNVCRLGAGHGEERAQNMKPMSVTLEVSKLSGWLNADAYCRESKGRHTVRGEVCGLIGGRRRATAVQAACRAGLNCRFGAGHGKKRVRL